MWEVSRGCSLSVEGRDNWVEVAEVEGRSFEDSWARNMGVGCWVFHRRARLVLYFVDVRRMMVRSVRGDD